MTWRYVDHPETGDMVPANTHAEVAEIAAALRATGLCAANVWKWTPIQRARPITRP